MPRPFRTMLAAITLALLPLTAHSQTATLLADRVEIKNDSQLIASGNVEIFYEDVHLKASEILYDAGAKTYTIKGPIVLNEGETTTILASAAELDADMNNGILQSARMMLDDQLQLAATELNRVEGRYTQLYKAVASSCQVCVNNPVPLWQIRAKSIIHDQQEKRLYFTGAQFRVLDVPVLYLPRLRMPDPTVTRARGFLVPSAKTSTRLGAGLLLPYFIPLGDSADVTVTPYISENTTTVQLRYRQAFQSGNIEFNAATSRDTILADEQRAYVFGTGSFRLPNDYRLSFKLQQTSDPSYLLDYGYSGTDRLEDSVALSKTNADSYFNTEVLSFETLRGTELAVDDQLPNFRVETLYQRRFHPGQIGGVGQWELGVQAHTRASDADVLGRDVVRAGGKVEWSKNYEFGPGLLANIGGTFATDIYKIGQDSGFNETIINTTPGLELELRWPHIRTTNNGAFETLEPVVHLGWSERYGDEPPDEDSYLVEFDEGNLYALSRFPGEDRAEEGLRLTFGTKWTRDDPSGWSYSVTGARVFRTEDRLQFSRSSGLDGKSSDWLLAGQLKYDTRLTFDGRAIFSDELEMTKAEARIGWHSPKFMVNSTYAWALPDPDENRTQLASQLTLETAYTINRHWVATADWQLDFGADEPTKGTFGVKYRNECVSFNVSLSRRFTSSSIVDPDTDIEFSVGLNGFGNDGRAYRRTCSG